MKTSHHQILSKCQKYLNYFGFTCVLYLIVLLFVTNYVTKLDMENYLNSRHRTEINLISSQETGLLDTYKLKLNISQTIQTMFRENFTNYLQISAKIEELKIPPKYSIRKNDKNKTESVLNYKLYDSEGMYFNNFLHYLDPWQKWKQHLSEKGINLTSRWSPATNNQTNMRKYKRKRGKRIPLDEYYSYSILNYPIKPLYLRSNKTRVCIYLYSSH